MSDHIRNFSYPWATAPDIIRSQQKDAYFQSLLSSQLESVIRSLSGARTAHHWSTESRTLASLLYLGLTTLLGNRTLGEEYTDIVQIEADSHRLPSLFRRAGYILSTVLLPYLLSRFLPTLRRHLRRKLERKTSPEKTPPPHHPLRSYLLRNLDTLTSPAPLYALSLATFYFTAAHPTLSTRLFHLRHIFPRRPAAPTSQQRPSYSILGLLLLLQLSLQAYLHLRATLLTTGPPPPPRPVPPHDLCNPTNVPWLAGRKCTLCLDPLRAPAATPCGHIFCWPCVSDWLRDHPLCPLCRQDARPQHVLPLRG